jgi:putative endonuclease
MFNAWIQKQLKQLPAHLRQGRWGEKVAARYLRKQGLRIVGRRIHVGRRDEFDLLAKDGETLVFVEVKTRGSTQFGRPASAVNREKRRVLSRGAVRYLKRCKEKPEYIRFDVVEVIGSRAQGEPDINHIRNAFQLEGGYRLQW